MAHLIDKSAIIAEIEKLKCITFTNFDEGVNCAVQTLLEIIDTLEVKEVDLGKEIDNYISSNFFGSQTMGFFANRTKEEPNDQDIALCAKHFFELGLKAKQNNDSNRKIL